MPHTIGTGQAIGHNLIKVTQEIPADGPPLIGINIISGALEVWNYTGGIKGSLITSSTHTFSGTVNDPCVVSYSPLTVCWRSGGNICTWNSVTDTLYTVAEPSGWTGFAETNDGNAYFMDAQPDDYQLWIVPNNAAAHRANPAVTETLVPSYSGGYVNQLQNDGERNFLIGYQGAPTGNGVIKNESGGMVSFEEINTLLPYDTDTTEWLNIRGGKLYAPWGESIVVYDDYDAEGSPNGELRGIWAADSMGGWVGGNDRICYGFPSNMHIDSFYCASGSIVVILKTFGVVGGPFYYVAVIPEANFYNSFAETTYLMSDPPTLMVAG